MKKDKMFNGYWMGYQPNGNTLGVTPPYVNTVTLFVAGAAPDGTSVGFNFLTKAYPAKDQIAWARQLQAQGTEVLMSIMDSSTIQWNEVDIPAYVQNFKDVVIDGEWGLNGVDIDLESGMPDDIWASTFTELIQEFRKVLGPKGTTDSSGKNISRMSVAAYRPTKEKPILSSAGTDLDWLNTMAYWNSATDNEVLFDTYSQYVEQVNLGIGVDYQNGMSTALKQVEQAAKFAAQTDNCGMMEFALNNDCEEYSGHPQWTWASIINENMNGLM
ncbi:glycosyl hydrolase family 18 protein [Roseivirga sp. 4D4]|uniref:EndoS/ChiA family endoglycosidase n=1 Tax=Roseivirga sp. 4D4 TaxID=1889784 RepID=UPI00147AF826|nr:glycosyl hydrolase family 18 protein [Roseivirga sp. 4D4]